MENQSLEKGTLLASAAVLISVGTATIDKNLTAGAIMIGAGVALYFIREFRKK